MNKVVKILLATLVILSFTVPILLVLKSKDIPTKENQKETQEFHPEKTYVREVWVDGVLYLEVRKGNEYRGQYKLENECCEGINSIKPVE